ncbi:serine protease [Methylobacterium sp. 77]|uniref:serine protease n=1 Tax=Methylobacterium sp. 77 TaxID=1101192 RepID=UPI0012DBD2A1|nr:serine protease [Methylobacterium sp. 77]
MNFPDSILQSVAFIFADNSTTLVPVGTGFFVTISEYFRGIQLGTLYFVTARHVIENCAAYYSNRDVNLRLNLKSGGTENISVPISAFKQSHIDSSADITAWQVSVDVSRYALAALGPQFMAPRDFLSGRKIYKNGIGTDAIIVGLYHRMYGADRNIPIVKRASISAVPEELIRTKLGHAKLYILETFSFGGLSGSPVFSVSRGYENATASTTANSSRRNDHGLAFQTIIKLEENYSLLGVVHGHWETEEENFGTAQSHKSIGGSKTLNEGMMLVTPIELFEEIVKEDHFCAGRDISNRQQIERIKISHPELIEKFLTD